MIRVWYLILLYYSSIIYIYMMYLLTFFIYVEYMYIYIYVCTVYLNVSFHTSLYNNVLSLKWLLIIFCYLFSNFIVFIALRIFYYICWIYKYIWYIRKHVILFLWLLHMAMYHINHTFLSFFFLSLALSLSLSLFFLQSSYERILYYILQFTTMKSIMTSCMM